jgi:NAD+ synthase (glutamine-hydrolysing)
MHIHIVQLNPTTGDFIGNSQKIEQACKRAQAESVDLVLFPELTLPGSLPEQFLEHSEFVESQEQIYNRLRQMFPNLNVVLGIIDTWWIKTTQVHFAAMATWGPDVGSYRVSDIRVVSFGTYRLAIVLQEDNWYIESEEDFDGFAGTPLGQVPKLECDAVLLFGNSIFHPGKTEQREAGLRIFCRRQGIPLIYCNQTGGHGSYLYEGSSLWIDDRGIIRYRTDPFEESTTTVSLFESNKTEPNPCWKYKQPCISIPHAIQRGIIDVFNKGAFEAMVFPIIGHPLSWYLASILVEQMDTCMLYFLDNEGYQCWSDIESIPSYIQNQEIQLLKPMPSTTRIRESLSVSPISNLRCLFILPHTKTEVAFGVLETMQSQHCCFSPIGDLFLSEVLELIERDVSRLVNWLKGDLIMQQIQQWAKDWITRFGYAYGLDRLDSILEGYVQDGLDGEELVEVGITSAELDFILPQLHAAEWIRRQYAPILVLSDATWGIARRYPLVSHLRVSH